LNDHVSACRPYKQFQRNGTQPSSVAQYFIGNQSSQQRQSISKSDVEDQVLKFFISANIPFRQADNEFFRELISWINVNGRPAQAPSRKVICARLSEHALSAKEDLKVIIGSNRSRISLALDCWTSRTNFGFLGTCFTLYIL